MIVEPLLKPYFIRKLRIAIIGTRGIPNQYGGFEQVAAYLGQGLVETGHEVTVYNPHNHRYQEKEWNGVQIVHCYEPGYLGSIGQFVYDLNCILDARKKQFDVWLMLGYTSSSIWGSLFPAGTAIVTNMDGLEWKRSKYSAMVKQFLRFAEKLAVRYSDFLVADSTVIQSYLQQRHAVTSSYIAYGATPINEVDVKWLDAFDVKPGEYFLALARMEPENNIAMLLEGFLKAGTDKKMLVIGNLQTGFGQKMIQRFGSAPGILFHSAEYDMAKLDALRFHASLYFHGHSCGGTNPSLLEAMASMALVAAHDNPFNRAVLGSDAFYFSSADDISQLMNETINHKWAASIKENNILKIQTRYCWSNIVGAYEKLLLDSCQVMQQCETYYV